MLAYTHRFLGVAGVARGLVSRYREAPDRALMLQVSNLRVRIALIQRTQAMGALSMLFCTASMLILVADEPLLARSMFAIALLLMLGSLGFCLREIYLSVRAINLELDGLDGIAE